MRKNAKLRSDSEVKIMSEEEYDYLEECYEQHKELERRNSMTPRGRLIEDVMNGIMGLIIVIAVVILVIHFR